MLDLRDATVVITGGAGFLGKYVCREMLSAGALPENIRVPRSRQYNLAVESEVLRMYEDMRPSVLINLAGRSGNIAQLSRDSAELMYDNLASGMHLLKYAASRGVVKFVQVGTACSYPVAAPIPYRESSLWMGLPEPTTRSYGISKLALSELLTAYCHERDMGGAYLVLASLYGPPLGGGQMPKSVIPSLAQRFLAAKASKQASVEVWGTGHATREFLFVADCARAIRLAAELCDDDRPINIGTGIETSMAELARVIAETVQYRGQVVWNTHMPEGQKRRCMDVSRAVSTIGFQPKTALRDGVRQLVECLCANTVSCRTPADTARREGGKGAHTTGPGES